MAGPHSRRRPVVFVLAAVLITAIVLIAQGAASSRPNASESVQAYLDQLRPGVQTSITDGADFADVRNNAATLGRNGIDRRLARLVNSVNTTLRDVDSLTPPPSMRVAQAYLVAALGVRAKAVAEARGAMDTTLTAPTGANDTGLQQAVAGLSTVGQDLELGDRAFALFVGAVPRNVQGLPGSVWVPDDSVWTTDNLNAYVTVLRSSATLTPVHDVAMIAFQTDPPPVALQNRTEVIPAADMKVSMVVENVGNQTERNVTIVALLTLTNGTQQMLRDFLDLAPGQRRAVTLVSMRPVAGETGNLSVTVQPVPGETNMSNNTLQAAVVFK